MTIAKIIIIILAGVGLFFIVGSIIIGIDNAKEKKEKQKRIEAEVKMKVIEFEISLKQIERRYEQKLEEFERLNKQYSEAMKLITGRNKE